MPRISPVAVAQWIERDCLNLEFEPLRDLLTRTLKNRIPKYSDEQVAEVAEELQTDVVSSLEELATRYKTDGVTPSFQLSSDDLDAYYKALASPEATLLQQLKVMDPYGFEMFCKYILDRLGGNGVVEGGTGDGGVDFFAFGIPPGPDLGPAPTTSRVFVIGQSKRQATTNITECQLREFVGGAARKAQEYRSRYSEHFGVFTPVSLAFWTTSDFERSAKDYARAMGLWYLSGVGLAQLALRVGLLPSDVPRAEIEAKTVRSRGKTVHSLI